MGEVLAFEAPASATPWILVTHQRPDTDAWCCLWAANKFIVPEDASRRICFISAGDELDDSDAAGHEILYMDVGGGDCDQHGKRLVRGSSFQLLVERYNLNQDGVLDTLLELTRATDSVERIDPTSIHYIIKGLPHILREGTVIDWSTIEAQVFLMLDILYGREQQRRAAALEFKKSGVMRTLSNGLKFATLFFHPELREAAYEAGAHVVMWTNGRSKNHIEVGIQVGRDAVRVSLVGVARAIRSAEAKARGLDVSKVNLGADGTLEEIPTWFLHDSHNLILAGSRAKRLHGDEYTKLRAQDIVTSIQSALSRL